MQIERLLGNIKNNNMKGFYVKTQENLLSLIKELVPVGSVVGVGDSNKR
ncbi:MAG: hypothetical protein FH762_13365 [Firmicutes bacterium]|nr:hypothetical protein [Bacillota bacterium]